MHAPKGQGQGPSREKGRRKLISNEKDEHESFDMKSKRIGNTLKSCPSSEQNVMNFLQILILLILEINLKQQESSGTRLQKLSCNSFHTFNGHACEDKWGLLYGNFKMIHNYMQGIGHKKRFIGTCLL